MGGVIVVLGFFITVCYLVTIFINRKTGVKNEKSDIGNSNSNNA